MPPILPLPRSRSIRIFPKEAETLSASYQRHRSLMLMKIISLFLGGTLVFIGVALSFSLVQSFQDRLLPGISIEGIATPNPHRTHAQQELELLLERRQQTVISAKVGEKEFHTTLGDLGLAFNKEDVLKQAFASGRGSGFSIWMRVLFGWGDDIVITPKWHIDALKEKIWLESLRSAIGSTGKLPSATLKFTASPNSLTIVNGTVGIDLDIQQASQVMQTILQHPPTTLERVQFAQITSGKFLSDAELQQARERALLLINKQLALKTPDKTDLILDTELVGLLAFPSGFADEPVNDLLAKINKSVERPAQDAVFEFDADTLKVKKFSPPKNGQTLNLDATRQLLLTTLAAMEASKESIFPMQLSINVTPPTTPLGSTNSIGINERIGFGDSNYFHSIPGRIHNVALTASRINNTIVKPGEEFSFNRTLGDVSAATGFQPAYVISGGKTVLGDGGGVCQVSSTLFRALLNAGLPITKRKAHSYRVSYYELNSKPGVDATVYSGDVDLRFINDTGHHLLIHTMTDSDNLYMNTEIYGTSDGRTAEIVDHKTWGFRSAPPAQYIDDPTLPRGRTKQIDFAASGISASFRNVVKDKDGKIIRDDLYTSIYQPWRAVFLRGI